MVKIVSVEGNIGSGKSTLVRMLQNNVYNGNYTIDFLEEPVNEWETIKDDDGINIIQKFYSDQEKYSFPFQMMAYISRLVSIKNMVEKHKNEKCVIICERSVWTDRYVFAKMLYDQGKIESVNFQIYLKWFDEFINEYPLEAIIHVVTPPDVCNERIKQRGREGENIPFSYLIQCGKYHDDWLDGKMKLDVPSNFDEKYLGNIYAFLDNFFSS
jgi:deoxyguanosine kinase